MPDRIEVRGAGKPGVDFIHEQTFAEGMVESLLAQRARYVSEGNDGLVADVDATIRHYGGTPPGEAPIEAYTPPGATFGEALVDVLDAVAKTRDVAPEPVVESGPLQVETGPLPTEPGCEHDGCVLMHPHAGPAILTPDAALQSGMVLDREAGKYRPARPRGRKPSGE